MPDAEKDVPPGLQNSGCVRCRVEDGRTERGALGVLHPRGGTVLLVCDRHGVDLLANGWTRVTSPEEGKS